MSKRDVSLKESHQTNPKEGQNLRRKKIKKMYNKRKNNLLTLMKAKKEGGRGQSRGYKP